MSCAIVGLGVIGQAHAFAHMSIDANRRLPHALAAQARAIGPAVVAKSLLDVFELGYEAPLA